MGNPFLALLETDTSAILTPYNLNFDGKVDIDDLTIAALAFGSYPGHPRWNTSADVNKME